MYLDAKCSQKNALNLFKKTGPPSKSNRNFFALLTKRQKGRYTPEEMQYSCCIEGILYITLGEQQQVAVVVLQP